jgi:prevent-host-death family protein
VEEIALEQARATLGDLVDRARLQGSPTLITRHGRPAAVLVGSDWYERAAAALAGAEGQPGER